MLMLILFIISIFITAIVISIPEIRDNFTKITITLIIFTGFIIILTFGVMTDDSKLFAKYKIQTEHKTYYADSVEKEAQDSISFSKKNKKVTLIEPYIVIKNSKKRSIDCKYKIKQNSKALIKPIYYTDEYSLTNGYIEFTNSKGIYLKLNDCIVLDNDIDNVLRGLLYIPVIEYYLK